MVKSLHAVSEQREVIIYCVPFIIDNIIYASVDFKVDLVVDYAIDFDIKFPQTSLQTLQSDS